MQTQIGFRPPLAWLGLPVARAQSARGYGASGAKRHGGVLPGQAGAHGDRGVNTRSSVAVRVYPCTAGAPGYGRVGLDTLPPLLANRGYAFQAVYTERFPLQAAIGGLLTVQACGTAAAAGEAIGCGTIRRAR